MVATTQPAPGPASEQTLIALAHSPPSSANMRKHSDSEGGYRTFFGMLYMAQCITLGILINRASTSWLRTLIPPEFVVAYEASGVAVPYHTEMTFAGDRVMAAFIMWTGFQIIYTLIVLAKTESKPSLLVFWSGAMYYVIMIPVLFGLMASDLLGVYGAERAINMVAPGLCRLAFAIVWLPVVHLAYELYLLAPPLQRYSQRITKVVVDATNKV